MADNNTLVVERRGAALWLTLNRPERRNALTPELVGELADEVAAAGSDPAVRAVVLTGAGGAFCSGGDLAALSAVAEGGARAVTDAVYSQFHRLVRALTVLPVPAIAAVNGPALGAGLDLALVCDLRLAADSAVFASSWINVGLVPGMGGAHLLAHAIGSTLASGMVLTGRKVDSELALQWGLVNEVVADGKLSARVDEVVAGLVRLSRSGLESSKASLRRSLGAGFEHELAVLGAVQGGLLTGREFLEATARFRAAAKPE
ncbi:enoyl-CoA hydratase/isomerase family protein [Streptomyces sp. NPDC021080]|uniref:enoyl-CoA hydratase/isomerase family protein n=1 Tax=Streptomyces sp. NPDC021080 TaxID=3365110 RepID=UPI0037B32DAC